MQNFLIIKTSSLGDIFQTLPAVLSLKKAYPDAKITWVVEKKFQSVLKPFPIDHLLCVNFKTWKKHPWRYWSDIKSFIKALRQTTYDCCIDFQANTKSGFILGLVKAKEKRSFSKPAEWPHRLFSAMRIKPCFDDCIQYYHSLISDIVPDNNYDLPSIASAKDYPRDKHIIMLGLGSMWPSKKLDTSQIQALMKDLNQDKKAFFVIPALEIEKREYQDLLKGYEGKVISKEHLEDYITDLLAIDYFVGVDSALLHLARLFKIPSKAYFGPSNALFYGQIGDDMGLCPYNIHFIKRCPRLRFCPAPCMKTHFKEKS